MVPLAATPVDSTQGDSANPRAHHAGPRWRIAQEFSSSRGIWESTIKNQNQRSEETKVGAHLSPIHPEDCPLFHEKIWFSFQSWNNCHWSFVAWRVIICIRIIYERSKVADEEARQWRGFNLMFSTLNMRGLPQQELCHPLWNDFRRSVAKARLNGSLMKAMGLLTKVRFFSRVLDLCLITG